jgi:uncharacterized protein YaaW (UPF0174 family)
MKMSKNDELDLLLQDNRLTLDDWILFAKVFDLSSDIPHAHDKRKIINQELRHSYGHTMVNIFREWYEPDYQEIVRATALKMKIPAKEHHTTSELEDRIIVEFIDQIKEQIIKKEGLDAWKKIEKDAEEEIQQLINNEDLPKDILEELKKIRSGGVMIALYAGRLAGISLYLVANQLFFALSRYLGLGIGVAVAGPIIGKTLSFLLGPAGWILTTMWMVYDLGNTNWQKVIPGVFVAAVLRRKLDYGN